MSDSPTLCTGFGTVTREVLGRLVRLGYEVAALGWGYAGWPYYHTDFPYTLYPGQGNQFGRDALRAVIEHYRPDVLVALGDLWMIDWLKDFQFPYPCRVIVYFPVDGVGFPQVFAPLLRKADAAIAYSHFGRRETRSAIPDLEVGMIYHGVDVDMFRPLGTRAEFKEPFGLGGKFVVGCVARNQPRKQYPLLVQAFARFSRDHDDAMLYIHADPNDAGWDLTELVRANGLVGRVLFSHTAHYARGIDKAGLNQVYNFMDVMALPTIGEGFGLPLVEAMAAGVPVLTTRCSACIELVEGRGELVDVKALIPMGRNFVEHALPDVDDLERKIRLLYDDPELRERHARAGRAFAEELRWENIIPQWRELFASFA